MKWGACKTGLNLYNSHITVNIGEEAVVYPTFLTVLEVFEDIYVLSNCGVLRMGKKQHFWVSHFEIFMVLKIGCAKNLNSNVLCCRGMYHMLHHNHNYIDLTDFSIVFNGSSYFYTWREKKKKKLYEPDVMHVFLWQLHLWLW